MIPLGGTGATGVGRTYSTSEDTVELFLCAVEGAFAPEPEAMLVDMLAAAFLAAAMAALEVTRTPVSGY